LRVNCCRLFAALWHRKAERSSDATKRYQLFLHREPDIAQRLVRDRAGCSPMCAQRRRCAHSGGNNVDNSVRKGGSNFAVTVRGRNDDRAATVVDNKNGT
jgi:hypothetical protein